ncbi:SH3 domain-containing protein [Litorilinea aerophila]|uniref:SH3 domain-containing protein n=1 Tax=Litorilinea aerophila TaxID=1204385 RepID=A0A540VJQ3_9CHLR|nr:SH3 domain-containing protein [Litorilinea aerophila]MCC9075479.1 SH3 domain-containing protein [Litorilinea aerophila]GIV76362.1 MAG: hypothetical protein KatS3mg050_0756 [Litorilinea sp.]
MTASPAPAMNPLPDPAPKRRRSWFWPGFLAGFLLLSLLSCGGLAMAMGIDTLDLAELQAGQAAWTPPAVTPTPVPAVQADSTPGMATGGTFQIGDRVRNVTTSRVNIRQVPGYLGKPEGDILAQAMPGDEVEILGGRAVADGLVWWRVRYVTGDGRVIDGWMAEATASGVQILAP